MPRSHPVASVAPVIVWLGVAMVRAVRPVVPAAEQGGSAPATPVAPSDGISTPAPPNPETPSATTPMRRAKRWFFIVPPLLRQCPIGQYSVPRRQVSSRLGPDATGVTRSALTTGYGNPRSWATQEGDALRSDGGVRESRTLSKVQVQGCPTTPVRGVA